MMYYYGNQYVCELSSQSDMVKCKFYLQVCCFYPWYDLILSSLQLINFKGQKPMQYSCITERPCLGFAAKKSSCIKQTVTAQIKNILGRNAENPYELIINNYYKD